MTYKEKLLDPRWQKKRLEILDLFNFSCGNCGLEEKTLHVHHCYYDNKLEPWEYEEKYYSVLCDNCHKGWHDSKINLDKALCDIFNSEEILRISGYAAGVGSTNVYEAAHVCKNIFFLVGLADFFKTNVKVIQRIQQGEKDVDVLLFNQIKNVSDLV